MAALTLARYFGITDPAPMALILALTVPLAILGAKLESMQRTLQNVGYNRLLHWARRGGESSSRPEILIRRSIIQLASVYGLFLMVSLLLLVWVLKPLLPYLPSSAWTGVLTPGWTHIWLAGSLGGLLALRIRRAYAILLGAALVAIMASATLPNLP